MKTIVIISALALANAAALLAPSSVVGVASALPAPTPDKPVYSAYKGVTIGMTMSDARTKLGTPKDKSDEQDLYEFSDRESALVYYDAAHSVKAVMITFTGKLDGAPTPKDVFGQDIDARPDGGVFKKVDYQKAGFWISYSKTGGDEPMVIIALNKL